VTRAPQMSERPRWRLVAAEARYEGGCALARAFVRKSGKQGFGVALQLRSRGDCSFAIRGARLQFAGGPTLEIPSGVVAPVTLPGRSLLYAWLPIGFDNDAAWNADRDDATLELAVEIAGQPTTPWRLQVHQQ
jgi:hypothetical protein